MNKFFHTYLWAVATMFFAGTVRADSSEGPSNLADHRTVAYFVLREILTSNPDSDGALRVTKTLIEQDKIESVVFVVSTSVPANSDSVVLLYDVETKSEVTLEESLESFVERRGPITTWDWNMGRHVVVRLFPLADDKQTAYRYRFGYSECNSRNGSILLNEQGDWIFGTSRFMCCF